MSVSRSRKPDPDDAKECFYTTVITLRNGRKIYAWQYGLKAFRIPIRRKKRRKDGDSKR
jgi:hypothetical protein